MVTGQEDAFAVARDACAEIARLRDPDRHLCAMFLPPAVRAHAFVLIAFNYELSRATALPVSSAVTGPMAGLIRLQWWRDVIEEPERGIQARHDVAIAVAALLTEGWVAADALLLMADAREAELCRVADRQAWRRMVLDSSGGMQRMIAGLLGEHDEAVLDVVAQAGAAFAVGALRRHLPEVLRSGRMPLPSEALVELGLRADGEAADLFEVGRLEQVSAWLRQEGTALLPVRRQIRSKGARLAMLPGVLAARDLRRGDVAMTETGRGIGDRLAVAAAGLTGR
ncbi:phytoene synthase [Acetobacter oeni LMG 21952]|nr:phytoene synthase [Acetobacter oeni LMG 21952]